MIKGTNSEWLVVFICRCTQCGDYSVEQRRLQSEPTPEELDVFALGEIEGVCGHEFRPLTQAPFCHRMVVKVR